jgi:hypothetical protein
MFLHQVPVCKVPSKTNRPRVPSQISPKFIRQIIQENNNAIADSGENPNPEN